eukprot:GDKI01004494.1.p1 GENE.GDKI01004494.1~~GDKI01004494.1.p1  ORF type:complete len:359 (-),score=134.17 GDKI01004494.1:153-1229(-)
MAAAKENPAATGVSDVVKVNVGGEVFAVERDVLAAVKGSYLEKMFRDKQATFGPGELDRHGNVKIKHVKPHMFRALLGNYLTRAAKEREFEITPHTPHPVVVGKGRQEYLEMLKHFSMEKEIQEATRDDGFTAIESDQEKLYAFLDGGRTVAKRLECGGVVDPKGVVGKCVYVSGSERVWRVKVTTPEEENNTHSIGVMYKKTHTPSWFATPAAGTCVCELFLDGKKRNAKGVLERDEDVDTVSVRHTSSDAPHTQTYTLAGSSLQMFENATIDIAVSTDGTVSVEVIDVEKDSGGYDRQWYIGKRWVCGRIPIEGGEYRLHVQLGGAGPMVTLLTPPSTDVLDLDAYESSGKRKLFE